MTLLAPSLLLKIGLLSTLGCTNKDTGTDDTGDCPNVVAWVDADGDGYGDPGAEVSGCDVTPADVDNSDDCDDSSAAAYPGGEEVCDGLDNDCDGAIDVGASDGTTYYADDDGDGYGQTATTLSLCAAQSGWTDEPGDCDDNSAGINPGATEVCDGTDNDCDGVVDGPDASDASTFYADTDGDGLGDPDSTVMDCDLPSDYSTNGDDCDDTVAEILECCTDATGGDWVASADMELEGGVYEVTSFTIDPGVTVTVTGYAPLIVKAQSIDIQGTLDASGADGQDSDSSSSTTSNGGDAVGGGGGGGAGGGCGNGHGSPGLPNGGEHEQYADFEGYDHGGTGGLPWGLDADSVSGPTGGGFGPGGGGGGGGAASAGADGDELDDPYGYGGDAFGDAEFATAFTGGAGGAGGGANGGGGGAGGGAVALWGNAVSVSGAVDVSGGDGGGKVDGVCTSGGGGGGGGGSIWLQGDWVQVTGTLNADGGLGGPQNSDTSLDQAGGDGSEGRIRVSGGLLETTSATISPAVGFTDATYPECAVEDDTIYDIQDGTIADGSAADVREVVVTGFSEYGFFAQEAVGGEYSGIYVYTDNSMVYWLTEGDMVNLRGSVLEYNDLTELDVSGGWVSFVGASTEPAAEVLSGADLVDAGTAEPWEGVLVSIESATLSSSLGYGEYEFESGAITDDLIYDYEADFGMNPGDSWTSITGPLYYSFGTYKIVPRSIDDMQGYTGVPD